MNAEALCLAAILVVFAILFIAMTAANRRYDRAIDRSLAELRRLSALEARIIEAECRARETL